MLMLVASIFSFPFSYLLSDLFDGSFVLSSVGFSVGGQLLVVIIMGSF